LEKPHESINRPAEKYDSKTREIGGAIPIPRGNLGTESAGEGSGRGRILDSIPIPSESALNGVRYAVPISIPISIPTFRRGVWGFLAL
jgi:hypothetical protein